MEVHSALGPGLLESAYQQCMAYELKERGLRVQKEVSVPVIYKDIRLDQGYRIDLLVNDELVIETKTVETLNDMHLAQMLTYLRFGHYRRGLLMNFNVKRLKEGIKRVVL